MTKLIPHVNVAACSPKKCDLEAGICAAARACPNPILTQPRAFAAPQVVYAEYCVECGDCLRACPRAAVLLVCG